MKRLRLLSVLFACLFAALRTLAWQADQGDGTFKNPVLYADYPDPDIIRVGTDFYMISTTFSDSPGLNVLHSKDMVNWEIASHVATNLNGGNSYNMVGGTAYRGGFWASSIRYYRGTFYVVANPTFSNSRIYYATNAAGPWQYYQLNQVTYDPGLFIETNGAGYIVAGHGPQSVFVLNSTFSQIVAVSNNVVNSGGEGSHVVKRGAYYYLFNANPGIWPYQLRCSRATNIFGPWETGHICLTATTGGHQGAIVDINDSDQWFGFVHQDNGAIGRMPRIGPVFWENDWPVFGTPTARDQIAASYPKPVAGQAIMQPAATDEFTNSTLGLQWQWNHNPDNTRWSLTARPGYLRLMPTAAKNFWVARNTLTQKGQGPWSRGEVKLDISHMQPGDICGLGTLGLTNGQIAVYCQSNGSKYLSMNIIAPADSYGTNVTQATNGWVLANVTNLFLRVDLDFSANNGKCYYSFDDITWTMLGSQFGMGFDISVSTFQGEKFAIFCYNANPGSGYVDVDWFHFSDKVQRGRPRLNAARTTFVADNGQRLRGPYTSTEWTSATSWQNIMNMKTLGFNAIHLYSECFDINYPAAGSTAPGYKLSEIDKLVAETRTNGLYLIITVGNGANNGNYNLAYITNFWALYSARYANETHVIYEIQNEPVAWGPPYSSANATPPGALNMEVAVYNIIRANAPKTPVLLFTYAVFGGNGGASAAMTDIRAFNTAVFGNANAVWTNEAVGFHGYAGWSETATAVASLINSGYPCMMTEFSGGAWGSGTGGLDVEMVSELERLNVSWLTFQYAPPSGVSDEVAAPEHFKNLVDNSGLSWIADYGSWPAVRGPYGNNGQPRSIAASYVNNFLSATATRIQAEDFDWGGEGVSYHDNTVANLNGQYRTNDPVDIEATSDTGGGYNITDIGDGEWLEYTIWTKVAGVYNLTLRYATPISDCAVQVTGNGNDKTGPWLLPNTGGSTSWATATHSVLLELGRQKIRLGVLKGGFKLNWFELTPASTGIVPNGTYKFLNAANGLTLTGIPGTNVVAATYTNSTLQQWNLQHIGGGQYKITAVANGNSWNVNNNAKTLGLSSGWGTGGNQCFILMPTRAGYYSILPVGNGVSLQTSASNPNVVNQQGYTGGLNQQWVLAAPSAPMFPTSLSAVALSATQVRLSWNAVANATSYTVKRSPTMGGLYETIASGLTTTTFTDTVPAGMRYYYVVTAFADSAESPNSPEASVGVPYPWMAQDINTAGVAGSASFNNGMFTIAAAGADIWGTSDNFRFVYVPVTGDCTMIARVTSVQNVDPWSKAGIMIRESLAANSANAYIAVTPGNGITWQYRTSTGGSSGNSATAGLSAPYWIKLVRTGNTFTGYRSADGSNWTQVGTQTFTMATTVYIGLAVTSHNSSSLCTATFDNVTAPGWSNSIPPAAPIGLAAMVADWRVNLAWIASTNTLSYNIKRAQTSGGPYTILANVTTTNYTDADLVNSTNFYYVVSALNAAGESDNSSQANVAGQIFTPSGLTVTPVSASQIRLTWNTFSAATSYNLKRSTNTGGPYTAISTALSTTNFNDNVIAGQKYYYVVSAMCSGVETPNSPEATFKLPYPWITQDVGTAGVAGDATCENQVFTVTGSGDDIWNAADAFRFVYVTLNGDCAVVARVASVQNINAWSKAGLMIRDSLAANAANAYIAVTPGNGVTFQYRSSTGGNSSFNNTNGLVAPYWLKLVRTGNTYTGYISANGTNWTQLGSASFSMATTACVGLALTSHNNSSPCTAIFDNVTTPNWPIGLPDPPSPPEGLVGLAGNQQVTLSWADVTNAISYNVKRGGKTGGPYTNIANVTTTNFIDTGVLNNYPYYYVVSALNAGGESTNSVEINARPLSPPNLNVALSGTNLALSWPLVSAQFTVQWRTNLALGEWQTITSAGVRLVSNKWQMLLPIPQDKDATYYRLAK